MSKQKKSVFVDPDPFTNQVIAEQLLSEEGHLHIDRECADGTVRTVWEFSPRDADRLAKLMMLEDTQMEFFREGPHRRLVSMSLEKTPRGLIFS